MPASSGPDGPNSCGHSPDSIPPQGSFIDGQTVAWPRTPRAALRIGIALAPEDRKSQGLILGMPAYDNINLTSLVCGAMRNVLYGHAREVRRAEEIGARVRLQPGAARRTTRLLSGGNQQKLVLAKWLDTR